jgi:hypothetical protein
LRVRKGLEMHGGGKDSLQIPFSVRWTARDAGAFGHVFLCASVFRS